MKFLHTADWHIGRTLNGFSLESEQVYAFKQILEIAKSNMVDGIIIAGDLYDRTVPNTDAVTTFNEMVKKLTFESNIPIYAISGNHDGARRLEFGHEFFKSLNFYMYTNLEHALNPVETSEVQIFLLPFLDPMDIRLFYKHFMGENDEEVKKYQNINDGIKRIITDMKKKFNPFKKQILVTHFAVTKKDEVDDNKLRTIMFSEATSTVGGLAVLTSDIFADFDYVALGHIHTNLASPSENIVYSGSPVMFNTKEAKLKQTKGVYIVDLSKENVCKTFVPLRVEKPIFVLEETFDTLVDPKFYEIYTTKKAWFSFRIINYDRVALTGINIRSRLEEIYGKDIVELTIDEKIDNFSQKNTDSNMKKLAPEEVITRFYQEFTEENMTDYQREIVTTILEKVIKEEW